jgi:hypothetical protein
MFSSVSVPDVVYQDHGLLPGDPQGKSFIRSTRGCTLLRLRMNLRGAMLSITNYEFNIKF